MYYRVGFLAIGLVLSGCAMNEHRSLRTLHEPINTPICETRIEYPGFRGGHVVLGNNVTVGIGPYHYNDMMYVMLGQNSQPNLLVARVIVQNNGDHTIPLNRGIVEMAGDSGASAPALSPDEVLKISRPDGLSSENPFHELGDTIINRDFKKELELPPGETDNFIVAFLLPPPTQPRFVITIGKHSEEIPICWGR